MKKSIIKIIALTLCVLMSTCVVACTKEKQEEKVPNKYTLTLTQQGQADITLQFEEGAKYANLPTPIQPSDQNLVTEWNIKDELVVESDLTVGTTTFTKGLEFEKVYAGSKWGMGVKKFSGTAEEIIIPAMYRGTSVISVGVSVFENNNDIKKVSLPEGLLEVKQKAFQSCNSITEINLPSTIVSVEMNAFSEVDFKGTMNIPGEIFEIPERAFWGLHSDVLILNEGTQKIGPYAFGGKNFLKCVVWPESLTEVNGIAFWRQPLESIFYMGDNYTWDAALFIDDEDYRDSNLKKLIESGEVKVYYYSQLEPVENGNFWHYENGVPKAW